jgi:hypothetical protein
MSTTPELAARVEALEKAVQSLLGAVKILETIHERGLAGASQKKAGKPATKKRAPVKKRAGKK